MYLNVMDEAVDLSCNGGQSDEILLGLPSAILVSANN